MARVLSFRGKHDRCAHQTELTRLRRDLHDELGPSLAGIMIRADMLGRLMRSDRPAAEEMLRDLRREAATFMAEFRRVLTACVDQEEPAELAGHDLTEALDTLAARLRGVVAVEVDVAAEVLSVPRDQQVAAFWIVKEALTNVAKHARATTCVVTLRVSDGLFLSVVDDGAGGLRDGGIGLSSMRARAEELGGRCEVTDTGAGVTVTAHLPLEVPDDRAASA